MRGQFPSAMAFVVINTSLLPSSVNKRRIERQTIKTGVSEGEPCPLGTYGNDTSLRKISDCSDCTPGYYCDQRGLTAPADLCDPGYYCLDGSYTSAPSAPGSPLSSDETDIGGLCPGTLPLPRPAFTIVLQTSHAMMVRDVSRFSLMFYV